MAGIYPSSLRWLKSRTSGSGNCVEVARSEDHVCVRNSTDRSGSVLSFTVAEWRAFVTGVRSRDFDSTLA